MYLSKLTLNLRNKQVRYELNNPYEMHRTLLKAFTENDVVKDKILFRIEPVYNSHLLIAEVLVQNNKVEPQWENLTVKENYFFCQPQTKKINFTQIQPNFYKFKLKANATVKRNGKRYALYKEEQQIEWLKRKGLLYGFEPIYVNCSSFTIGSVSKTKNAKSINLKKSDIYHFGVNYIGIIKVTNASKFIEAISSGIGPAKAFGFGMLTIAKND